MSSTPADAEAGSVSGTLSSARPAGKQRSEARTLALQALCLYDSVGPQFSEQVSTFLRDPENHADLELSGPNDVQLAFAAQLANGAWEQRDKYDRMLEAAVAGWSIKRMPPVDRNLLRLGLHEWLALADMPFAMLINELIELSRRFGGNDSPKFVNGVLDGIRRKMQQAPDSDAGHPTTSAGAPTGSPNGCPSLPGWGTDREYRRP